VLVDPLGHGDRSPDRDQAKFPQVGEENTDDTQREINV
jgi:hypothetical protein